MIRVVRQYKTCVAIAVFITLMSLIHCIKPALIYSRDGGFRPFGLGYQHKTVVPMWIASIALAILSYLAVIYYITYGQQGIL